MTGDGLARCQVGKVGCDTGEVTWSTQRWQHLYYFSFAVLVTAFSIMDSLGVLRYFKGHLRQITTSL